MDTDTPIFAKLDEISYILGGMVFCTTCNREASYVSSHSKYSDENYRDCALMMLRQGWAPVGEELDVRCPDCLATTARR